MLRESPDLLRRERLQVLSDWFDEARVVSPSSIDWKAIADDHPPADAAASRRQ